jgi:tRNA-splicing ligase RtcB (3'-phosphate/5'-hydroxy nucleic acid ligase)
MISVVNRAKVPIKLWAPIHEVESSAIDQLVNTANLPCVFKHVAAMPDVHLGKGATVGSVVATKGAVIPACVGVDIGCGMMAVQTPFTASQLPDSLKGLRSEIETNVPVGPNAHKSPTKMAEHWAGFADFKAIPSQLHAKAGRAMNQLGTLGGGNHFIEVCIDTDQRVWVMLHSGSRNIGKEIAEVYIHKAKDLMKWYTIDLADPDLAYLIEGSREFQDYWRDLQWAQSYAMKNREIMMAQVMKAVGKVMLGDGKAPVERKMEVNCHHNYADREHHFGANVIVTRKGALRARVGDMGIIPGSMGTRSYIVRGLGNPESFCSCSHGAGRRMSRGAAKRMFTQKDFATQTAGVECRKDSGVLDEIPGAYKNIDQVMENQKDLVEIVATLKQVMCVKG